ncbi:hypothetical protein DH2020_010897 [Rehmannia glutinosa]|uniref:TRF2/HOY1 PH-like domain-containing protein n=1 Tax=Rehmannia glutinosa TaxID=99300 RepID=A0ABR0XBW0_REHGL
MNPHATEFVPGQTWVPNGYSVAPLNGYHPISPNGIATTLPNGTPETQNGFSVESTSSLKVDVSDEVAPEDNEKLHCEPGVKCEDTDDIVSPEGNGDDTTVEGTTTKRWGDYSDGEAEVTEVMGSLHSLNVEDFAEEEHGSLTKRSRLTAAPLNQLSSGNHVFPVPPSQYNPLDEPSPLGLRLRKSPSLLDLIQMRLSQGSSASISVTPSEIADSGSKKDVKGCSASSSNDKLKASNFPASLLRIGSWELARQPAFFRETNPQPRKHTLWQATTDFTDGQASINRQHYIQCPPGVLNKHYEKLIQCDTRLSILSRQPEIVTESPYFESEASVQENSEESKGGGSNQLPDAAKGSPISVFEDAASSAASQLSSFKFEHNRLAVQQVSKEAASPSSVMDTQAIEGNRISDEHDYGGHKTLESLKVPGLRPSMASECQDMLENISQVLLNDTNCATGLDEKSLMKKVNSLCCLLQQDSVVDGENRCEVSDRGKNVCFDLVNDSTHETPEGSIIKQAPALPRRDSLGDLLLHLPRIASLPKFPKFLFGIAEDDEYRST